MPQKGFVDIITVQWDSSGNVTPVFHFDNGMSFEW